MPVEETLAALGAQHEELSGLLAGLAPGDWARPTRCEGWAVSDVVLHLAQTDELAIASATGRYEAELARLGSGGGPAPATVDEAVAAMVDRERGLAAAALYERWWGTAARLRGAFEAGDLSERVRWVAGFLSLRTLATTRLAETWIHSGDVADAVGVILPPTDRLRLVARLAWRTLPYAFGSAGGSLRGPVAFRLTGPEGQAWDFVPDEPAATTIRGTAADLCAVAARRVPAAETGLQGSGPDAAAVLDLVRTYA